MAVTINEGTQTDILTTLVGGTETGIVRLDVGTGTTVNDFGGTIRDVANVAKGTLSAIDYLTNGTVRISIGTISKLPSDGTITQVTVLSNLTNGSVNILTGSITVIGGTVGGAVASGAAASGNPNIIGGTNSGGSVYSMLVDTAGNPQVDVITVPQVSVGTLPTLNITTGTINVLPQISVGTVPQVSVGTLPTLNITTGTVTLVPTVTTVSNLTNGSVNILTGTIQNSGTTTGVGVVSNLTNGSVNVLTGTVTSVTNLAGGTVRIDPTSVATPLTFGTLGTAGGSFFATISAASGAGTRHYISGLQVVGQTGTADIRILAGTAIQGTGVIAGGQVVPAGGFARDFSRDFQTGTNSEIVYHFVGAGTAFITINYWKGA